CFNIPQIQISKSRREKTYVMYSNENEHVGNKLLEDQSKSVLDTNNPADAKTTRITRSMNRLLYAAEESSPKRLAKNDLISGTPDENNSDKSYHLSSYESPDSTFIQTKRGKINYTYDWFMGQGVKKSVLSEDAKKDNFDLDAQNVSSGVSSMIEPESLSIIFGAIKNEFAPYYLSAYDALQCHKVAK
ncbi:8929_t:CDS:2, partial [Paraglomus brasilianum]